MASATGPTASKPAEMSGFAPCRTTTATLAPKITSVSVPKPGPLLSMAPSVLQAANSELIVGSAAYRSNTFGLSAEQDYFSDATNGASRDGRIRNPVPSKLKGRADANGDSGSFCVMHMDVKVGSEAAERGAQAKRTSEGTELAAKRATENGNSSHKKPKQDLDGKQATNCPSNSGEPSASQPKLPRVPLSPVETKQEQARLLTLLRSLQPILIVDHLCKALAFFGGVPDAPPPPDGVFPQSAEANGPGNLFVGWIAEIFPLIGSQHPRPPAPAIESASEVPPVKRKRGRPKGSKSTKARKDKVPKKILAANAPATSQAHQTDRETQDLVEGLIDDDIWQEAEEDGAGDEDVDMDKVDVSVMLLAQATSPQGVRSVAEPSKGQKALVTPARLTMPAPTTISNSTADGNPNSKKRGRPKGSKNRPKDSPQPVPTTQNPPDAARSQTASSSQSFTAVNTTGSQDNSQMGPHQGMENTLSMGVVSNPTSPDHAVQQQNAASGPHPPQQMAEQLSQAAIAGTKRKRTLTTTEQAPLLVGLGASHAGNLSPPVNDMTLPTLPVQNISPKSAKEIQPSGPKRQRKIKAKNVNESSASIGHGPASVPKSATAPLPNPSSVPVPTPAAIAPPESLQPQESVSMTVESATMDHSQYGVHSPTLENYEAQLRAQFEHAEPESSVSPAQGQSSGHLLQGHAKQPKQAQQSQQAQLSPRFPAQSSQSQQQQQSQQSFQQRQQYGQQSQQQPFSFQSARASHSQSPNLSQQAPKSQTASPGVAHQTSRITPSVFPQYRATNASYGQPYVATKQNQPQSQPHSNSPQLSAQPTQPQQYSASSHSSQPSQYSNQGYGSHYSHGRTTSLQRYPQHMNTSTAATSSYTSNQTPPFSGTGFANSDSGYRSSASGLNPASYATQRSQSVAPSAASGYRNHSISLPLTSSTFGGSMPSANQQQPRSSVTSNATHSPAGQNMQALGNMSSVQQSFPGGATADWQNLFDTNMDAATGHNSLAGLGSANYAMNSASVARAPSSTAAAFTAGAMSSFDNVTNHDRYYGSGRR